MGIAVVDQAVLGECIELLEPLADGGGRWGSKPAVENAGALLQVFSGLRHFQSSVSNESTQEDLHYIEEALQPWRPFVQSCHDTLRRIHNADEALAQKPRALNPHAQSESIDEANNRRKLQNRAAQTTHRLRMNIHELNRLVEDYFKDHGRNLVAIQGDYTFKRILGHWPGPYSPEPPPARYLKPLPPAKHSFAAVLAALKISSLSIFQNISTCTWFIVLFCTVILLGSALSLWYSWWKNDISGGFTLGTFVTGAGCGAVNKLHGRHREDGRCRCKPKPADEGIEMGSPTGSAEVQEHSSAENADGGD